MLAVVLQFPGSNADWDALHALRDVVGLPARYVFHKEETLPNGTDLVVLPGGFSYGDYLRCGAIARFARIMNAVKAHAERGGLVLGICNGFQILTEAGLLPGALVRNTHLRFECRDVTLRVENSGPFTRDLQGQTLTLPIAHGEGRYHAEPSTLDRLEGEGLVAFRYVHGNPNGSERDIAGIYGGPKRNICGLMPHPERACEALLGSDDGKKILTSAMHAIAFSR